MAFIRDGKNAHAKVQIVFDFLPDYFVTQKPKRFQITLDTRLKTTNRNCKVTTLNLFGITDVDHNHCAEQLCKNNAIRIV